MSEQNLKTIPKLLRAIAGGVNAKSSGHDIIFLEAAAIIDRQDAQVKALEAIAEFCSGDMTSLGSIARLASIQNEARNALASIKVSS